ncbi:MAG: hypothetical protein IPL86_19385 [Flavobacteriales bacterium]|nr:hypothetical protein [Flavobacteriales bacterium]
MRNATATCPAEWASAIQLSDPPIPVISSVTPNNPTDCGAENGTISILANAGTGTFQYSITGAAGPWQSSPSFTGLAPGSYEVWVRNATATCPVEWASAIQLSDPPLPVISSVTPSNPTDCGAENGSISILANAGTGTFQYSITGAAGPWQSSPSFTGLASGSYEVWVRNATATCPVEWASAIQLSDPPLPVINSVTPTHPTDCGVQNGTISIFASAGTGTFQYSISGAAGPWQTTSSFTGLAPGNYEVWVRNATATCPVEWASVVQLSDPPLPVISSVTSTNPTDCGAENGTINILAMPEQAHSNTASAVLGAVAK